MCFLHVFLRENYLVRHLRRHLPQVVLLRGFFSKYFLLLFSLKTHVLVKYLKSRQIVLILRKIRVISTIFSEFFWHTDFREINFLKAEVCPNQKCRAPKIANPAFFELLDPLKLIALYLNGRKVLKCSNNDFHTEIFVNLLSTSNSSSSSSSYLCFCLALFCI